LTLIHVGLHNYDENYLYWNIVRSNFVHNRMLVKFNTQTAAKLNKRRRYRTL